MPGDLSLHSSPFLNDKIIVKKTCCCQKSEIPGDVSMYFTPNFCAKDFPAENGEFVIFLLDVFLCVVNLEVVIIYSYCVLLYIGF